MCTYPCPFKIECVPSQDIAPMKDLLPYIWIAAFWFFVLIGAPIAENGGPQWLAIVPLSIVLLGAFVVALEADRERGRRRR